VGKGTLERTPEKAKGTDGPSRFGATTISMAAGGALIGATFFGAPGAVLGAGAGAALNVLLERGRHPNGNGHKKSGE
jgi:hypothetical protein